MCAITVKSALLGSKKLPVGSSEAALLELRHIIMEHRAMLVGGVLAELGGYVEHKFRRAAKAQLQPIRDQLIALKDGPVKLANYESLVEQRDTKTVIQLIDDPFFAEIDVLIGRWMNAELKTIKS